MFADESTVMELLIYAGQARSDAMEAIKASRQKSWDEAEQLMESSEAACREAHKIQTALIGQDEGCGKINVNLILVHAQDHLMTAMLCQDLAKEIISLRKEVFA
ncbi:PTS lactose/cellobiose transporter subunit IIA [Ewingella americana]|uniref:PTS lactose/cellobiose transporter subunit IIA n=1 Tax=Ewingella americana TaxID=41202 RepID=UPI0016396F4F|nr:PTS lactose/cellobiose transporter subunit IIA [Ewingella americana]QMV52580.1 PTS lactose/cellobiose transporter subunit IIA [Ewingella americana]